MYTPKSALRLVDLSSSLFWTLAGVISVGCTVTAVNQRIRVQEEELRLMRERNAVARELTSAQADERAARAQLQLLDRQLEGTTGWGWRPVAEQLAQTVAAGPAEALAALRRLQQRQEEQQQRQEEQQQQQQRQQRQQAVPSQG